MGRIFSRVGRVVGFVALVASMLTGLSSAATATTPPVGAHLNGIVTGPDHALWFTDGRDNTVGRITTAGVVTKYSGPDIKTPDGIAVGSDGALWFTNFDGNSIGRITTAGVLANFTGPGLDHPAGITAGPDGALWFTNFSTGPCLCDRESWGSIGRITTAGLLSVYSRPGQRVPLHPIGIVAGSDGNLWYTNYHHSGGSVARITPAGVITNFKDQSVNVPNGIASGPDGALWFTNRTSAIGRITTAGTFSSFRGGRDLYAPGAVANGPDGNLWFTNGGYRSGFIGRITTAGVVLDKFKTPNIAPIALTNGPDGAEWFADTKGSIGRVTTSGIFTLFPV